MQWALWSCSITTQMSSTVHFLAKNLNADAFVVARANRVKSVEKIYRAGADYVASVPIVASHMLAKIIQKEEEELGLLYEDLEIKLFAVDKRSRLVGRTLEEIDLPGKVRLQDRGPGKKWEGYRCRGSEHRD